jgi:hypothetical protein
MTSTSTGLNERKATSDGPSRFRAPAAKDDARCQFYVGTDKLAADGGSLGGQSQTPTHESHTSGDGRTRPTSDAAAFDPCMQWRPVSRGCVLGENGAGRTGRVRCDCPSDGSPYPAETANRTMAAVQRPGAASKGEAAQLTGQTENCSVSPHSSAVLISVQLTQFWQHSSDGFSRSVRLL